jgi:esterase/lipase superfamily enzyme
MSIVARPTLRAARLLRGGASAALALVGLLTGCGSDEVSWTMMPPPVVMTDPRLDFARRVPPADRDTDVRVLYATTRAPAPAGARERYQRTPGDRTRLGQAEVQLGEPGWSFADLMASDKTSTTDTLRPARLTSVQEFGVMGEDGDRAFVAAIDRQVLASPTGEAVIYVPGYRVTFDQVLVFMGAWAHYLGRSSAVVAFSWPTGTRVWNYFLDCRRARAFIPEIERLIALVAEKTQARRLNLIAFSCGSPLLAEALVRLRERHPDEDHAALQRRYRVGNALFVAADVDLKTFARSHLPALSEVAARTEVYVSEDDGALKWSGFFARASRLGRPRFEELTRADLETLASNERLVGIDVTGVYGPHELGGMRGHGYFFANPRVSSDVLLSMIYPFDPAWRGLVHPPGRGMWTFPDDYPERVKNAVYTTFPALRREGGFGRLGAARRAGRPGARSERGEK